MRRRIVRLIGLTIAAGALVFGIVSPGGAPSADPITCPPGQESTKVGGGWDCVNNGGNPSNAEDPRNPNADKGDF